MANCRTCGAPILWARTEHGRRTPLNADPVIPAGPEARGLFLLRDRLSPEGPLAISARASDYPREAVYTSHFATCPQADEHRKAAA